MFPLRDDNPHKGFPFVVLVLIVANVYVFYHMFMLGIVGFEAFTTQHALIPARDFGLRGSFLATAKPFFASMFMHGGLLHLLANMWSFWIFGDNVEKAMGPVRFIIFYLLCGLAAALTHCYLNPHSAIPVVGASGAIAGVMGAYLLLFPKARIHMFTLLIFYPLFFDIPAWVFLVIWFMGQILSGAQTAALASAGQDVGGIAFAAHIGGFVAGMVLLPIFRSRNAARVVRRRA